MRKFGFCCNSIKTEITRIEVTAKMMQDESIGVPMKKFDGLFTQSIITGGFNRLRS